MIHAAVGSKTEMVVGKRLEDCWTEAANIPLCMRIMKVIGCLLVMFLGSKHLHAFLDMIPFLVLHCIYSSFFIFLVIKMETTAN